MNDFEKNLLGLLNEGDEIQKRQRQLQADGGLFTQKLHGFFKEHGLPEDFTLPQLAMLAVRKARELIKV